MGKDHSQLTMFRCEVCSKTCTTQQLLVRHMSYHSMERLFKCPFCLQKFKNADDLGKHTRRLKLDGRLEVCCTTCHRHFKDEQVLLKHKLVIGCDRVNSVNMGKSIKGVGYTSEDKHASLEQCETVGKDNEDTIEKTGVGNVHDQLDNKQDVTDSKVAIACKVDNSVTIPADNLSKSDLRSKSNLTEDATKDERMKIRKNDENADSETSRLIISVCRLCNTQLNSPKLLKEHYRNDHENTKLAVCLICGRTLSSVDSLLRHHDSLHEDDKPFTCDFPNCQMRFKVKNSLCLHQKFIHNSTGYTCEVCNRKFVQPSNLRKHMNVHSSSYDFKCSVCSKLFRWKEALKRHLVTHTKANRDATNKEECDNVIETEETESDSGETVESKAGTFEHEKTPVGQFILGSQNGPSNMNIKDKMNNSDPDSLNITGINRRENSPASVYSSAIRQIGAYEDKQTDMARNTSKPSVYHSKSLPVLTSYCSEMAAVLCSPDSLNVQTNSEISEKTNAREQHNAINVKQYHCFYCPDTFATTDEVSNHLTDKHSGSHNKHKLSVANQDSLGEIRVKSIKTDALSVGKEYGKAHVPELPHTSSCSKDDENNFEETKLKWDVEMPENNVQINLNKYQSKEKEETNIKDLFRQTVAHNDDIGRKTKTCTTTDTAFSDRFTSKIQGAGEMYVTTKCKAHTSTLKRSDHLNTPTSDVKRNAEQVYSEQSAMQYNDNTHRIGSKKQRTEVVGSHPIDASVKQNQAFERSRRSENFKNVTITGSWASDKERRKERLNSYEHLKKVAITGSGAKNQDTEQRKESMEHADSSMEPTDLSVSKHRRNAFGDFCRQSESEPVASDLGMKSIEHEDSMEPTDLSISEHRRKTFGNFCRESESTRDQHVYTGIGKFSLLKRMLLLQNEACVNKLFKKQIYSCKSSALMLPKSIRMHPDMGIKDNEKYECTVKQNLPITWLGLANQKRKHTETSNTHADNTRKEAHSKTDTASDATHMMTSRHLSRTSSAETGQLTRGDMDKSKADEQAAGTEKAVEKLNPSHTNIKISTESKSRYFNNQHPHSNQYNKTDHIEMATLNEQTGKTATNYSTHFDKNLSKENSTLLRSSSLKSMMNGEIFNHSMDGMRRRAWSTSTELSDIDHFIAGSKPVLSKLLMPDHDSLKQNVHVPSLNGSNGTQSTITSPLKHTSSVVGGFDAGNCSSARQAKPKNTDIHLLNGSKRLLARETWTKRQHASGDNSMFYITTGNLHDEDDCAQVDLSLAAEENVQSMELPHRYGHQQSLVQPVGDQIHNPNAQSRRLSFPMSNSCPVLSTSGGAVDITQKLADIPEDSKGLDMGINYYSAPSFTLNMGMSRSTNDFGCRNDTVLDVINDDFFNN